MPRPIDLRGVRFGRLVVKEQTDSHICKNGEPKRRWICECDCGNVIKATTQDLRKGDVRSCGCLNLELRKLRATKHNGTGTKLHHIWMGMKRRCYNPNSDDYKWYGGKGVKLCDEWKNDFASFRDWSLANGFEDNLTIDRINGDGDYEPNNCRWVSMLVQNNNRCDNIPLTYNGETHNISEWARIKNVPYTTLYMRVMNGWDAERVLTEERHNPKTTIN